MKNTSSLELPFELKQKIKRVAQERNEEPATSGSGQKKKEHTTGRA